MPWRAQLVQKHRDGLPRDHFVNTFHFTATTGFPAGEAEDIAELVRDFMSSTLPNNAAPLHSHLSGAVALTGHEVRVYPIDTATGVDNRGPGQPPAFILPFDHTNRGFPVQANLPAEVALCLSYKNVAPSAAPPSQRRGRIYLGPFASGELFDQAPSDVSRPDGALRQDLIDAGTWLMDAVARGHQWVVYSRPYDGRPAITAQARKDAGGPFRALPALGARLGNQYPVTAIWVDDAWDTQRRRGEAATGRLTASV